ncbi:hypothetical protein GQ600_25044 [Phytophthora cactorum]|nr:hypothetical protein GQ600_25044 [Phytophthora cactorum]
MDFMYGAGGLISARRGVVQLPGKESVAGPHVSITARRSLPGEHAVVRIRYGQSNPQREVLWAGRGKQWVTEILYAARSWTTAVKVMNISDTTIPLTTHDTLARIAEWGLLSSWHMCSSRKSTLQ